MNSVIHVKDNIDLKFYFLKIFNHNLNFFAFTIDPIKRYH